MEESFIDRLTIERDELSLRMQKLAAFINDNAAFEQLDETDRDLLIIQRDAMRTLYDVLTVRLRRAEAKANG